MLFPSLIHAEMAAMHKPTRYPLGIMGMPLHKNFGDALTLGKEHGHACNPTHPGLSLQLLTLNPRNRGPWSQEFANKYVGVMNFDMGLMA